MQQHTCRPTVKETGPGQGRRRSVGGRAMHRACRRATKGYAAALGALLLVCITGFIATPLQAVTFRTPTRSTNIALTSDDRKLLVVNRETDSLSIIEVRNAAGVDRREKLAEIAVGREPRCVAIHPDDSEAYVANAVSGTVSVIALTGARKYTVVAEIKNVGTELRGCALTPNAQVLYVASHTEGRVTAINPTTRKIIRRINVGGNPTAIAITNNRDPDGVDSDERVFVTLFFAEFNPAVPANKREGFDNGRVGVVQSFPVLQLGGNARIPLSPIDDVGFTADRTLFCRELNPLAVNDTFCPDPDSEEANDTITKDPQGAFPNQLFSALIRGRRLFVPSIGAGPEPPVVFNVNVQGLVHVVNTNIPQEERNCHVNLNAQVAQETPPASEPGTLDRAFLNDIVAIDANRAGNDFLLVSRGGNYVMRAGIEDCKLTINAPDNVVRFQTGNLPTGVVVSLDGKRAYTNNEVDISVTRIDLEGGSVIPGDIPSGTPPEPGTFEHAVLVGKLAFFTALGIPDEGNFGTPIRQIDPVANRGKASRDAWSGCASCHPDGLTDNVTWIFGTGPRSTVDMSAFFSKLNPGDQRISNWSAVMGSVTDFNNNARGVQGGVGFSGGGANVNVIFQHGATEGASESLDLMTLWVQTIRPIIMPNAGSQAKLEAGGAVFVQHCASCHGGPKWTKSQVIYDNNPTFDKDPGAGGVPLDDGVINAGAQIRCLTLDPNINDCINDPNVLKFLENVGTFNASDNIEVRGQGLLTSGLGALGGLGFNVPSLLGIGYTAPYLHHGKARTLGVVFAQHRLSGNDTIADVLTGQQIDNLLAFLQSIDGSTAPFDSATDEFLDGIGD